MPTLTIRFDLPEFKHGFVWEGDKVERAKLKATYRELAAKGGTDLQSLAVRVIAAAPKYLTKGQPERQRGAIAFITAWALDLSSGHPTHPGTIDDYIDAYDFVVTVTDMSARGKGGRIECRVEAAFDKNVGTA
jgi:hypothetical protein